jgi:soluble lytic murein transglycosylase-like protein
LPAPVLLPVFQQAAAAYGLAPALLRAVAEKESSLRPCAVSPAGALGLMQLMPETAAWLGITDPFDVEQNVHGAARFLRFLLDRFDNDLGLALGAYNAGPGRVESFGGIPPIPETQDYVAAILRRLRSATPGQPR